jgi:hypothetical protein
MPRLDEAIDKFSLRWLRIEKDMAIKELKKKDDRDSKFAQANMKTLSYEEYSSMMRTQALPIEDRIKPFLLADHIRLTFIANELRARRYFALPLIRNWEEDYRAWCREVAEWTKKQKSSQSSEGYGAVMFRFPGRRPAYLPPEHGPNREAGELEVKDMILSAKSNPRGGGWKRIPQKINGKYVTYDGDAPQSSSSADSHIDGVEEEDLQLYGVDKKAFTAQVTNETKSVNPPIYEEGVRIMRLPAFGRNFTPR